MRGWRKSWESLYAGVKDYLGILARRTVLWGLVEDGMMVWIFCVLLSDLLMFLILTLW